MIYFSLTVLLCLVKGVFSYSAGSTETEYIYLCQMSSAIYSPTSNNLFISSPLTIKPITDLAVGVSVNLDFKVSDNYGSMDYVFNDKAYAGANSFTVALKSDTKNTYYLLFDTNNLPASITIKLNHFDAVYGQYNYTRTLSISSTAGAIDSDGNCAYYYNWTPFQNAVTTITLVAIIVPIVVVTLLIICIIVCCCRRRKDNVTNVM